MEISTKLLSQTGLAMLIAVCGMSCASSGGGDSTSDSSVLQVTGTGTGDPSTGDYFAGAGGGDAVFVPDSYAVLSQYVASHPLNAPTNFRINVNLTDTSNGWGGRVQIGYYDSGQVYTGIFTTQNPSGSQTVRVSYKNYYTGDSNAAFNQWFVSPSNTTVFHGFFQDSYGSIVLVLDSNQGTADSGANLGDGLGSGGDSGTWSGSVYFKNFATAPAPQFMDTNGDGVLDGEMCWFLFSPSPYACGTFFGGAAVSTTSAVYPSAANGYTRLGTFTGLTRSAAFAGMQ